MDIRRVIVTPEAIKIIEMLKEKHGELVFNQSGGCCDGTAPMCYEKSDFGNSFCKHAGNAGNGRNNPYGN